MDNIFKIHLAYHGTSLERSQQLIREQFSCQGYSLSESDLKINPTRITLVLDQSLDFNVKDAKTVGTITLVLDEPLDVEAGETFKAEVDNLRSNGRKLAELTNFTLQGIPNNKRLIASLFHVAFILAHRIYQYSDFVIEVHRHSQFYEKMLGFKRCGSAKTRHWANAPALLLHLDMRFISEQIIKFGGELAAPEIGKKSLYPYFFSAVDEIGITQRLLKIEKYSDARQISGKPDSDDILHSSFTMERRGLKK